MTTSLSRLLVFAMILTSACTNDDSLSLEITSQSIPNSQKVRLDFAFNSKIKQVVLFDKNAFSVLRQHDEDIDLSKDQFIQIIDSLQTSQFVIENLENERRFISNIVLFEGEKIVNMTSSLLIDSNYDTLSFVPNRIITFSTMPFDINRLKIKPTDDKVRLTYLFHPSDEQQKSGYKKLIITSNWFSLPRY